MPSISPTALDATDADARNRRRKAVKRAISALQTSLTEEDVSLDTLDQTIAILKDARNLSNGNSPGASRQPSPPNAAQSSSANRRGHKRNTSDQYAPDNLTVWMRLRHTSKPSRGYRVQYEGAWTTVTTIGGLQASSIFPNPSRGFTDAKLKQLTSEHLDWNSSLGSPFISIFTDQSHAEDWALKWSERNGGKVASLLVIDCNKITRLLSIREVVRQLGIETTRTEMVPEQYEDEYVAINQIPTEAIIENRPIFSQAALDAAAGKSSTTTPILCAS